VVQFSGVRPALSLAASQAVVGVQLLGQELVRPPAPSLVRRPSGAEGDIIGGGRAATLSGRTAPLSAFHRAIADKSGERLNDDSPNRGI
jgi:hypothetical protein